MYCELRRTDYSTDLLNCQKMYVKYLVSQIFLPIRKLVSLTVKQVITRLQIQWLIHGTNNQPRRRRSCCIWMSQFISFCAKETFLLFLSRSKATQKEGVSREKLGPSNDVHFGRSDHQWEKSSHCFSNKKLLFWGRYLLFNHLIMLIWTLNQCKTFYLQLFFPCGFLLSKYSDVSEPHLPLKRYSWCFVTEGLKGSLCYLWFQENVYMCRF